MSSVVLKAVLAVKCRKASEVFCGGLSRRHDGLLVALRLSAVRQVDFFAKVLADGTVGFM